MPRYPLSPPPPPEPADLEPGLVRRAGNAALGGLAAVGNLLDVPGSMVRDALSLQNPFDQLLPWNWFDSEGRTTGRQMLRNMGLVSKRDSFGNAVAGMALDFALDPLTYASLGTSAALTEAGKATKALGIQRHAQKVLAAKEIAGTAQNPFVQALAVPRKSASMLQRGAQQLESMAGKPNLLGAAAKRVTQAMREPGRRRAMRTVTLDDMLDQAGELGVNAKTANWTGTAVPGVDATKEAAKEALDRYAVASGFGSGDAFVAAHGKSPLAKSARVGVPLMPQAVMDIPQADRLAFAMDAAENLVRNSLPGRALTALFHAPAMSLLSRPGQMMGENVYGLRKDAAREVNRWAIEAEQEVANLHKDFATAFEGSPVLAFKAGADPTGGVVGDADNAVGTALQSIMRLSGEMAGRAIGGQVTPDIVKNAIERRLGTNSLAAASQKIADTDQLVQRITDTTRKVKAGFDAVRKDLIDRGLDVGEVGNDMWSYWARRHKLDAASEFQGRLFPRSFEGTKHRTNEIRNVPTEVVEEVVSSTELRALPPPARKQFLLDNYYAYLDETYRTPTKAEQDALDAATGPAREELLDALGARSLDAHAEDLATWIGKQPKAYAKGAEPGRKLKYYPHAPLEDAINHLQAGTKVARTMDAIYETILRNAGTAEEIGQDAVPMAEVLAGMGLKDERAVRAVEYMQRISGEAQLTADQITAKHLPRELASDINRMMRKYVYPEDVTLLGHYIDKATRFIKQNLTLPFPAFAVRNLGSGQFINLHSEQIVNAADYRDYGKALDEAWRMMKSKGMSDPELLKEVRANGVFEYAFNPADVAESVKVKHYTPPSLVEPRQTFRDVRDQVMPQKAAAGETMAAKLMLETKGNVARALDTTETTYETAMEMGRRASATGEWFNRVPMYLYLRKYRGWSPVAAAQKVADMHIDYGNLTSFEKTWMRRLMPFYAFTRGQLTQTFQRLLENQGGLPMQTMAGTIKATNRLRSPGELVPDYVAETASIPLGEADADGNTNYLTGFGMAFEDPLSFLGKGLRGAGMEALSRLNPLLKGPLEYTTGELFFQSGSAGGRDLPDADPLLGRTLSNITGREDPYRFPELVEVAVANSPLSRYLSTTRQLADPRKSLLTKAVNLGTGARVATISEGARDAILREDVQHQLRQLGGRAFVRTYIPEPTKARMSPAELAQAEKLTATMNTLADRAKARKRKRELAELGG